MNIIQISVLCILIFLSNLIWNIALSNREASENISDNNFDKNSQNNSNQVKSTTIFFTILAVLPLLSGLYFVNSWFKEYNIAVDSINWKTYPVKIILKSVDYYKSAGETGHQVSGKLYQPEVEYIFKYNNITYKSNVIDYLNRPIDGDKRKSQLVIDSLPEIGQPVDVYYSPNYEKSVLIPGAKNSNYFGILGGGIFFIIGLISLKFIYQ